MFKHLKKNRIVAQDGYTELMEKFSSRCKEVSDEYERYLKTLSKNEEPLESRRNKLLIYSDFYWLMFIDAEAWVNRKIEAPEDIDNETYLQYTEKMKKQIKYLLEQYCK